MKKLALSLIASAAATAAAAHPSLVPHEHPHDASALFGLDWLLVLALLAVFAVVVALKVRRS